MSRETAQDEKTEVAMDMDTEAITPNATQQRTSIAALDLPIHFAGDVQSISKSQSTPLNNIKNDENHLVINIKSRIDSEDDDDFKQELPAKGVLHRAHSLDSGKVCIPFC